MTLRFVDTNIFTRFITKDDPQKGEKCYLLFKKCQEKKISLVTNDVIIAEVVYILSSKALYNLKRRQIVDSLRPMLTIPTLKTSSKKQILFALELYASSNLDFEDCLTTSYMHEKNIKDIYSYDKDFDKLIGIKRFEP